MIDTIEPGKINIKELVVPFERPKKDAFNLRQELLKDDWVSIIDMLSTNDHIDTRDAVNLNFFFTAARIKMIDPSKLPDYVNEPKYSEAIIEQLDKEWETGSYQYFMSLAGYARTLYPDIPVSSYITKEREEKLIENVNTTLESTKIFMGKDYTYTSVMEIASLKMIDPELMTKFEDLDWLKNHATGVTVKLLNTFNLAGSIEDFAKMAPVMKVLFPETSKDINITNEHWDKIKNKFDQMHTISPWALLSFASSLAMLSADEIKIDNKGTRLVFKSDKSLINDSKSAPEIRKF
jgi:hypothetical protein